MDNVILGGGGRSEKQIFFSAMVVGGCFVALVFVLAAVGAAALFRGV